MSRHWLTLGQDCIDLHAQLIFLRDAYVLFKEMIGKQAQMWPVDKKIDMGESFDMLKSQIDICMRWTRQYHERTNIRINLLFHFANQRESRTNTEITASTAKVAEQTQRDSASMTTIAAVTMIFLPGTFISAILSMAFFDYDDSGVRVSTKWCILLAATISLNIIGFAVWLYWRYVRLKKTQIEATAKVIASGSS
ncbi:hypothetical protein EK21DRAFT_114227 [Setomelanomma holmii]|uniref:Uncharacterized protein n=1 Tax=Setomelanomma holmii TaxID=210430 RepID=A0A9P4LJU0_9PLEO|nr:hypothetical protein EK21DRAFT_114227 [Setomelanomma holmii]